MRLGREALWVGLGQLLTAAGAIAGVRVLTDLLKPAEYGTLVLALTFGSLSQLLFFAPVGVGPARFLVAAQERGELRSFSQATRQLLVFSTLAFVAASCCILLFLILTSHAALVNLFLVSAVLAFATGLGALLDGLQGAARQRAIVGIHSGLGQWLRVGSAVIAVRLAGPSTTAILIGFTIAVGMVLVSQAYFFRRYIASVHRNQVQSPGLDKSGFWRTQILKFGWPFAVWGPAYWLQSSADRWAIEGFINRAAVGYYSAAYQIGYQPVVLIANVVLQLIAPISYQWAGDGADPARVARAHRLVRGVVMGGIVLTAIGAILAYLFGSRIFRIVVDPRYESAAWLLPWLVVSAGLFSCGQAAALFHLSAANPKALLRPKLVTGILGALLNVAGAAFLGLRGIVFAGVTFSAVYCGMMLLESRAPKFAPVVDR